MTEADLICIKPAETDEELCGRGYMHCTVWKEAYRGIVCDMEEVMISIAGD